MTKPASLDHQPPPLRPAPRTPGRHHEATVYWAMITIMTAASPAH